MKKFSYQSDGPRKVPLILLLLFLSVAAYAQVNPGPGNGGGNTFSTVQIETVELVSEECEKFGWYVKFKVDNPSPNGGWIVQEINLEWCVWPCDEIPEEPNGDTANGGCKTAHYWEAWNVPPNADTSNTTFNAPGGDLANDGYTFDIPECTWGWVIWEGKVGFVANPTNDTANWTFGGHPNAGNLWWTEEPPVYWENLVNSGNATQHDAELYWICCKDDTLWDWDTTVVAIPAVDTVDITEGERPGETRDTSDVFNTGELTESIDVYPNPGNGLYYLVIPEMIGEEATVQLADGTGKLLRNGRMEITGDMQIDIRDLPDGIYVLRIVSLDQQRTALTRLVKQ